MSHHHFTIRSLAESDRADLSELAKYTYDGRDYICTKLSHWLSHAPHYYCVALVYDGLMAPQPDDDDHLRFTVPVPVPVPVPVSADAATTSSSSSSDAASEPVCSSSMCSFIGHVVGMEVLCHMDVHQTCLLSALRVHPLFRGLGLASRLHSHIVRKADGKRCRETVEGRNVSSLHLAKKYGLQAMHTSSWCAIDREQAARLLKQTNRQLKHFNVDLPSLELTRDTTVRVGTATEALKFAEQHASNRDIHPLRQYWLPFDFTLDTLWLLCGDSVLTPSQQSLVEPNKSLMVPLHHAPYLLLVSSSPTSGDAAQHNNQIDTMSLVNLDSDFTAFFRSVTLYGVEPPQAAQSPTYHHMLLHLSYHLQAMLHNVHETWKLHPKHIAAAQHAAQNNDASFNIPAFNSVINNFQLNVPLWFTRVFSECESLIRSSAHVDSAEAAECGDAWMPMGDMILMEKSATSQR